jgi:hypothetical protein
VAHDLARDDVLAPQGLEELVLAVTLEPGQPDQLTSVHGQVNRFAVGTQPQPANGQDRGSAAGRGRFLLAAPDGFEFVRASHQADEIACRPRRPGQVGHRYSRPHDRDAIADLFDLVYPVGDEDDADSLGGHPPDDGEKAVTGGHVECGRRLVEDQDARVAQ